MEPDRKADDQLLVENFNYCLPERLIAQTPVEPRDHSRLMVLDKKTETIHHRNFFDLPEFINSGDVLVFNDSRVISARLYGWLSENQRPVELLLLRQIESGLWESLVKPGRRMREGADFFIKNDVFFVTNCYFLASACQDSNLDSLDQGVRLRKSGPSEI